MSYRYDDEALPRRDVVIIPIVWLMALLSLLIHIGALTYLALHADLIPSPERAGNRDGDRLRVVLADKAAPAPSPPPPAAPPTGPAARADTLAAANADRPRRVLHSPGPRHPCLTAPTPLAPLVPPPPPTVAQAVPVPAPAGPPLQGDLSAYIRARRAARQESEGAPPPGDALNRSLAANLPAPAQGVAADNARQSGGVFTIKRMDYDDAAFAFYGWNNEMRRKTPQMIEVRKGNNSDMRIAVVRRMIAIIRDFEKEDFVWESPQRGRTVVLSARPADNAALESFLMHDFFDGPVAVH